MPTPYPNMTSLWLAALLCLATPMAAQRSWVSTSQPWPAAAPESQGLDPAKFRAALDFMAQHCGPAGLDHLLVIRRGQAVFAGARPEHRVDNRFNAVALSLVAGALWDQGKFRLEDLAHRFEPRLANSHEPYRRITLHHFLSRTAGYDAVGGRFHWGQLDGSKTPFEPGEPFNEPGAALSGLHDANNMLALVLTKVAGEPLEEVLNRSVTLRLGIARRDWTWGDYGYVDGLRVNRGGENQFVMSANDLARLGWLLLQQGRWEGQQVLSAAWVERCLSPQVPFSVGIGGHAEDQRGHVGYFWELNRGYGGEARRYPELPGGLFVHHQWRNNFLLGIPEWEMLVVRLGEEQQGPYLGPVKQRRFLQLLAEAVIDRPTPFSVPSRPADDRPSAAR